MKYHITIKMVSGDIFNLLDIDAIYIANFKKVLLESHDRFLHSIDAPDESSLIAVDKILFAQIRPMGNENE